MRRALSGHHSIELSCHVGDSRRKDHFDMIALVTIGLLASFLCVGCMNVRPPTNAMQAERWDAADGEREAILRAVKSCDTQGLHPVTSDLLAWSIKVTRKDAPPHLVEEVLVLSQWQSKDNAIAAATLHVLERHPRMTGAHGYWHCWGMEPVVPAYRRFDHMPTEADICTFMRDSNFGRNECDPGVTVLAVWPYKDSTTFVSSLETPISPEEKAVRYAAYINSIGFRLD